jgi:hypothetical protein
MIKENNENLKELLARFLDAGDASKAAEDIIAGEHILDANPAPQPSPDLLAVIKQRMSAAATGRNRRRFLWECAAAAAAIVVVAWSGMFLLRQPGQTEQVAQLSQFFWQETDDNALESRLSQIEQPDSDTPMITLDTNGSPETVVITDVANEISDIANTFWEG